MLYLTGDNVPKDYICPICGQPHTEFYERLVGSDIFPSTSQVTPAEFEDAYKEVVEAGDEAVVITISSQLSGTYQRHSLAAASGHLHLLSLSPQFLQVFAQISPQ